MLVVGARQLLRDLSRLSGIAAGQSLGIFVRPVEANAALESVVDCRVIAEAVGEVDKLQRPVAVVALGLLGGDWG